MKAPLCLLVVAVLSTLSLSNQSLAASPGPSSAPETESDGGVPSSAFTIPGPLRSFLRMAGISQQISRDEVLPLLSRNIYAQGYEGSSHETEFLVLLARYVVQARELADLASKSDMTIRVSNCEDARPLLLILGYRAKPACGEPNMSLQTADARRAFLTIDSGFPLPELEQDLRQGKPFAYHYESSNVPVLFAESDWTMASKKNFTESSQDLINTLIQDPSLARLYWALSRMDPGTSVFLQREMGLKRLLPYAAVLDFYGQRIWVQNGRVVVPGGATADAAWKELIGASPESPTPFIERLLLRDRGWLAAYFDVLSRASSDGQSYFTESHRLRAFYQALRTPSPSDSATTGVFRPAPGLLLLVTRLQRDTNGEPLVPGNLEVWKEILHQKSDSRVVRQWSHRSPSLENPDQLVRSMFAVARAVTDSGPLQIYLAASEIDSRRPADRRLSPATVRLLAHNFADFSDQYRTFAEFPELSDSSIALFLNTARYLNDVPDSMRSDALGTFQANLGIWQILARQGEISKAQLDGSWQGVIRPFAAIRNSAQLYEAGRASLGEIFQAATGRSSGSEDEIIDLLAGPAQTSPNGIRVHQEIARRLRGVLDGQRLVSIDTLLTLGNALDEEAHGRRMQEGIIRLASETREFQMPRPIFSNSERTEWAPGIYNNHHTDVQMRSDVERVLKSANASRGDIEGAIGQLAPFFRDTLVGLNYAYYEPPGSQALLNNPLFVRSHDFAADTVSGLKTLWQAPQLLGQGSPAGGGAHFVGSIADLPYVLSDLEQDFISPENVQALIWKEITPGLLTNAILPRWWNVTPTELHAVALYQESGEELIGAAAKDGALRAKVLHLLADRLSPKRLDAVEHAFGADQVSAALSQLMPADKFYLTAEFEQQYPNDFSNWGPATSELQDLRHAYPDQVNMARLSQDFGVPHPSLADNYGQELLNVPPMPAFSGVSSRLLAESWDSPNLYWARLADEKGYPPVMLNDLVPRLTRRMIEKVFATDLEDWPALLRAMDEVGAEFREGKIDTPIRANAIEPASSAEPNAVR